MACSGLAWVELSQRALRDPLQHFFGENSQQLPADIQSLKHRPVIIGAWRTHTQTINIAYFIFMLCPCSGMQLESDFSAQSGFSSLRRKKKKSNRIELFSIRFQSQSLEEFSDSICFSSDQLELK